MPASPTGYRTLRPGWTDTSSTTCGASWPSPDNEYEEPLPDVPAADTQTAFTNAVPLINYSDGSPTGKWVKAPPQLGDDITPEEYFAVQIAGTALGLGYRGGLVFASPFLAG